MPFTRIIHLTLIPFSLSNWKLFVYQVNIANKYFITPTNIKQVEQHDFKTFEFEEFFEDSIYSTEVSLLGLILMQTLPRDFLHARDGVQYVFFFF